MGNRTRDSKGHFVRTSDDTGGETSTASRVAAAQAELQAAQNEEFAHLQKGKYAYFSTTIGGLRADSYEQAVEKSGDHPLNVTLVG